MEGEEYKRGVQDQRLEDHDEHFRKINGSQEQTVRDLAFIKNEMAALRMDLQRLADAVEANQKTVATTAAALESERKSTADAVENQRVTLRDSTERRWSPLSRIVTIITIIVAITGLITWFISIGK